MPDSKKHLQKIQDILQAKVAPIAGAISSQRHISAVKDGLMFTVPLTILGGFALILAQPPVDPNIIKPVNFFYKFLLGWKEWATVNAQTLMIPYNMTIGLLGLFAVVAIAYNLASSYEMNPLSESISALLTFLAVVAPATIVDTNRPSALFISTDYLGAKGIFTAIIIALLTVEISRFLINKNIKIKMPSNVPPMVSAPFESLIPVVTNIILFLTINQAIINTTGMNIPQAIMTLLSPAIKAIDSLGAIILTSVLTNFLWFFGIHGGAVVQSVIQPFTALNFAENAQALAVGESMPHIFAGGFFNTFINIGGSGAALGLALAILIVAKSAQLKSVFKVAIIPVIFGISEPLVFGVPIIMNPYLFIPIVCAPIVNSVITYFVMSLNLVGKIYISFPFTTPGPIAAFLGTMDWKAVILWCILVIIDTIIYIPFVKLYDIDLQKREARIETEMHI
ncbi:PTS system, lactose/cellobiose family IIC subunit [Tepidanaerobacter acetatoxydans Re1]|uniref:Permease IIC component n=1 Tax=Tepidanaerobacter acetatoxydans (strain DSM 21804 / JCM 16047 / Re1) TaxID=1209989 RepID=F4LWQ3_TEPAE|nr:PTS transporter subunit EIIC [Tepidanaerobacter acetatoxydans]AEE91775.1 PTS system, lactose/cellobiose family IIC subunit [Tepidanaerobacter acetatoxydans Re1]CDI40805.1 PTS system, lactose/cellobiose family IIC subunit [Tepidanaerobacter acetatoxydans Re1]